MNKSNCQTSIILSVCMTVLSFVGFGASCRVLSDSEGGTGDWSQSTRWNGGQVPQQGDDINIYSSITATDADMAILQRGAYIVARGMSVVLTIDVENDYTVSGEIDGPGKCVKCGSGSLTLNKMSHQIVNGIVVEEGDLVLDNKCKVTLLSAQGGMVYANNNGTYVETLDVRAPSVAYMPPSGHWIIGGLTGDGSLLRRPESTGNQQVIFSGASDGRAFEFSGSVSPNLSFTISSSDGKKANQRLLKAESESTGDFRFVDGVMGVAKIGNSGNAGSFGTSDVWMQCNGLDSAPTLLYLGTEPETTSRKFAFTSNPLGEMTLDAGAFGGVTFTGKFRLEGTGATSMMRMALTGSNMVNACQLTGEFAEPADAAVYMTKRGSGIWRFPATSAEKAKYKGVFAVESGTLEYESLAEAGSWCSLGFATLLHSPYSGTRDDVKTVPYAYLLGNGGAADDADLATFSYVGSSDVDVATRPVALKGGARLRNATDRGFALVGVTSAQPGRNDLVLDGAGTDNRLVNVTNGVGSVGLVKEGVGTWTLEGRVDVTGGVAVKEGTLNLNPADPSRMTWFRFTVKKLFGATDVTTVLCHFGLFDVQHNDVALGVTYNADANGKTRTLLRPGQAAFETADCSGGMDGGKKDMNNLFKPYALDYTARWSRGSKVPDPDVPSTCPSLIIRLPASVTAPVVAYDMITGWYDGVDKPFHWTPTEWTVEGSVDGVTWTPIPLDAKTGWTKAKSGGNYWLSDASPCSGVSAGFPVTTTTGESAKPLALGALSVASSATLAVAGGATVSEWDLSSGVGAVSGIAFAPAGTLKVTIPPSAGRTYSVSCDLQGCTGLENLKDWTLLVNGEPATKWSLLSASEGELVFTKAGLVLIFK